MFRASFISRLPPSLQIHLSGTEMGNIKELTQTADRLWLCHGPQMVAAVQAQQEQGEEPEETVAAVAWQKRGPPSKKGEGSNSTQQFSSRSGQRQQRGGQRGGQRGKQEASNTSKWVCFKHFRFGSRAHFCEDEERCSFSGN